MTEAQPPESPADAAGEEPELPPHQIEPARSSRSKCRTCKRKIEKGELRIGVLLEGPYGTGYLWHHLKCAARRRFEDVEEAYRAEAWAAGVKPPPLAELEKLRDKAQQEREAKKELPHAERAPSGRSKCKHCGETIAKDGWRVVLGRTVEFYGQARTGPINVHATCVGAALREPDCATEAEDFEVALRANSSDLSSRDVEDVLREVGALEE